MKLPNNASRRWILLAAGLALMTGGMLVGTRFLNQQRPDADPPPKDLAHEATIDLERRNYSPLSVPLDALLADNTYKSIPTQAHPLLGMAAPEFSLLKTDNTPVSLAESLKKGPVVLVFYYGYHCDHCVSQLFALNKDIEKFRAMGATVLAISADPVEETQERFRMYGAFDFSVLSDPSNSVATQYGTYMPAVKAGEDGNLMHGTFVIDKKGHVVWANRGDGPFTENRTILVELSNATHP
jgi:peroxiredoxin